MAVSLLESAPPTHLLPLRPCLHHRAGRGGYLSERRLPPVSLSLIRMFNPRGPVVVCSSQYPADYPNEGESPEVSAVDTVENELGSSDLNIWQQMVEIAKFAGPATGIWICGPLMSLIDTMVIGQGSSLELAALGPGTVFCDNLSYIFMFLSIATSNMVATSVAKKDKALAQSQISMLLFVAFASGLGMLFFTKLFGFSMLTAFSGSENVHLVTSANLYIQIRGLAWPAILVGMVAQSASLGMKDSWGPLKALVVASVVNGLGDIFLCSICGYGITGAAWATMFSQVIAALMMMVSLSKAGFSAFSVSIPSQSDLFQVYEIAAPVFVTMTSKVAFYSLLTYFATSMGTLNLAAHQVMINVYCMCTVWGEPLSQSAQSFMPELIYGVNRSLTKDLTTGRMIDKGRQEKGLYMLENSPVQSVCCSAMSHIHLINSKLGHPSLKRAFTGIILGMIGTTLPWFYPKLFTADCTIIAEMHKILLPYFIALMITPSTHSLEGTLLAGRDLRFLSLSMTGCFCLGGFLVLLASSRGFGLPGCWWSLAIFQWSRFSIALQRLTSPHGMLYNEQHVQRELVKLKGA